MIEFIINSEQLERMINAIEHKTGLEITRVVIDDRHLPEIVRCRVCKHYYEAENYHPNGNYVMRCCKYFDAYNDEVEPDGFCAWGELKQAESTEK